MRAHPARPVFFADDIVAFTAGTLGRSGTGAARGVSTDSRTIREGELFVALKGPRYDGHLNLVEAFKKGAWGALVSRESLEREETKEQARSMPDKALISVSNTLKGLGDLARGHRKRLDVKVAAVTGSNGKTTTKEMLAAILAKRWNCLSNEGNLNNLVGLPLTVLGLDSIHEVAVLEMGMNRRGEIRRLTRIARPDIGVVTNVGPVHLEQLENIEGVAKAKAELLEEIGPSGTAVVNADDPMSEMIRARGRGECVTFGLSPQADVRAEGIRPLAGGSTFTLSASGGSYDVSISFVGEHNVMNALAAAAAAIAFGAGREEIRDGLAAAVPAPMRFSIAEYSGGIKVVNDAYNANPVSMKTALDSLEIIGEGRRRAAVLGDMLELGDATGDAHRSLGRDAAGRGFDLIVAVGDQASEVVSGAVEAGCAAGRIHATSDCQEAAEIVGEWLLPGDLLLLKGSRGVGLEKLLPLLEERGALRKDEG